MNLPPFPLSPLDDGKPPHRIPHAVTRVEADGDTWILRPCNGLLFARRERQNTNDWTWTVSKPPVPPLPPNILSHIGQAWTSAFAVPAELPSTAAELDSLWREALANNWLARFVLHNNAQMDCVFPHFFRSEGTGFVREFWNREDFAFDWKDKRQNEDDIWTHPLSHFQKLATWCSSDLFSALNDNWNFKSEQLHFICVSEAQLSHWVRLICNSEPLFIGLSEPIEIEIQSENGFQRAHLSTIGTRSHYWYRSDTNETGWASQGWNAPLPPRLQHLFDLALDENTPVGTDWEYNDQFSGRASVLPYPVALEFSFPPPSQHEYLEARLALRDWLQSRVPARELKQLL